MRKATVRDLRYRFREVEALLQEGEDIEITKRKRVIARLIAVRRKAPAERPQFLERLKQIYGNKKLKLTAAKMIASERSRS
jgi:antitoxin (DNA-binding transcriptional repressor) of toxin-antitoxin stability system